MEVAGLILGAIPILLEGIDKYCELYGEWVKSTDLLAKRRRQLTIEHLKLKHALAYLSPDLIEEEVNARLVLWYPDECSTIVGTIMDLNQTIWKLRERMDIDEKGRVKFWPQFVPTPSTADYGVATVNPPRARRMEQSQTELQEKGN